MSRECASRLCWLSGLSVIAIGVAGVLADDSQKVTRETVSDAVARDGYRLRVEWLGTSSESAPESVSDAAPRASANGKMPPDGISTGTVQVTVTDGNGNPVSGVPVSFAVTYIVPGASYRTEDGMAQTYVSAGGNGAKARADIRSGRIRLIGTVSPQTSTSGADGVAQVEYRTSHIGSDLAQAAKAVERVTATLPNGSATTLDIEIGYDDFVEVPSTAGGLQVVGATGKHVQSQLAQFLQNLGTAVVQARWPHPVTVTAASLHWGGQYPPHFTHKYGGTLDIRAMSTDGNPTWAKQDGTHAPNYDAPRTKALITVLKNSGATTIYFNGKDAGGTPLPGHDNHIHVSWLTESRFTLHLSSPTAAIKLSP